MKLLGLRLPGIHSIHWKVFVFHMAVLIVPMTYIAFKVRDSIETSYLHSTEEGMIDTAVAVSELYTRIHEEGGGAETVGAEFGQVFANIRETLPLKSRLFGYTKNEVDVRLLAYDAAGRVIFDTEHGGATGADFSRWRDVRAALAGQYGSRWELDRPVAARESLQHASSDLSREGGRHGQRRETDEPDPQLHLAFARAALGSRSDRPPARDRARLRALGLPDADRARSRRAGKLRRSR